MSKAFTRQHLLLALLLITIPGVQAQQQSGWRFSNRLQTGWEYDSNVFESIDMAETAQSIRFLLQSRTSHQGRAAYFQLSYSGGLQLYPNLPIDNKLINQVRSSARFTLNPRITLVAETWARLKIFLNRETDYGLAYLRPYINFKMTNRFSLQVGGGVEGLDYAGSDFFDYSAPFVFVDFSCHVSPALSIKPKFRYKLTRMQRKAFAITPDGSTWYQIDEPQNDRGRSYGLQMDYYRNGLLINLSFFYEASASNSYGADYDRQVIVLALARQFSFATVRLYGTLQQKNYRDQLLPFWPIISDTEEEKSNFLILDISRQLSSHAILSARASAFKNESPDARFYYQKGLFALNIEFLF